MKSDNPEKQILNLISEIRFDSYTRGHNDCLKMERHFKTNESYEKGLNDAWECAQKLSRMTDYEIRKCFNVNPLNTDGCKGVISHMSASEAIEKMKEYKEKNDEIKVGDEVHHSENGNGVVTKVYKQMLTIIWADGTHGIINSSTVTRIGKTFPQIIKILEAMKGQETEQVSLTDWELDMLGKALFL